MIFKLEGRKPGFPNPYWGDEHGLLAVGGKLNSDWLREAYSQGIFPWFSFRETEHPYWFCPLRRFVIFPKEIHISHSMRNMINRGEYSVTFNLAFEGVIRRCAEVNGRINHERAWLGEDIIKAYTNLHKGGLCISVEVWRKKDFQLVGGLYGVTVENSIIGESMFSDVPNASKLALITLAKEMDTLGLGIIDCQFETPHLKSMGGRYISYDEYLKIIHPGARRPKPILMDYR